jgi:hypothetical protein
MAAEAGIIIAAVILGCLALAALFGLRRRRRKEKEDREWEERHDSPCELQGDVRIELQDVKSPTEVDVWHPNPLELEVRE